MKKYLSCLMLGLSSVFASCQSSEQKIIDAVNQINESCPILVASDDETITEVKYADHEVTFYVSLGELRHSLEELPYQKVKELELNPKAIERNMRLYLGESAVREAFKNVSLSDVESINLQFKAILQGKKSNIEIVQKMSWNETLHLKYLTLFKK